jgi:hypothetical protein
VLLLSTIGLVIGLFIGIIRTANHEGFVSAGIIVAIIFVAICGLCLISQVIYIKLIKILIELDLFRYSSLDLL